jgi:hypothetical protein
VSRGSPDKHRVRQAGANLPLKGPGCAQDVPAFSGPPTRIHRAKLGQVKMNGPVLAEIYAVLCSTWTSSSRYSQLPRLEKQGATWRELDFGAALWTISTH